MEKDEGRNLTEREGLSHPLDRFSCCRPLWQAPSSATTATATISHASMAAP